MIQLLDSHTTFIKQIKQQLGQILTSLYQGKNGILASDTTQKPKKDQHFMAIATSSVKILTNPIYVGTKHEQVLEQAGRDEDEDQHVDDLEDTHQISQPKRGKESEVEGNIP